MGQKVHPFGFRVGITEGHKSRWYAPKALFAELLVEDYGFPEQNVRLITDKHATKDSILQGFNDILLQAKEKDRVVVFFAGHGETYSMPSVGDRGY